MSLGPPYTCGYCGQVGEHECREASPPPVDEWIELTAVATAAAARAHRSYAGYNLDRATLKAIRELDRQLGPVEIVGVDFKPKPQTLKSKPRNVGKQRIDEETQ